MKNKKVLTLFGSACLVLALVVLPFMAACAPEEVTPTPPEEVTPTPPQETYKISIASIKTDETVTRAYSFLTDLINWRGEGRIEATYYDGVLGGHEELLDSVTSGALDIITTSAGSLVRYVPWAGISNDIPFSWTSPLENERWHENVWIPEMNKALAQYNVKLLPYVNSQGSSVIVSRAGPIHSPADIKGKVFRSYSPGLEIAWMEALGAKGTVVPTAELFTAMEQGIVDLMHNPPAYCLDLGFADICKDFTITNHKMWRGLTMVNLPWWNSLPEDIQAIIERSCEEASAVAKWQGWNRQAQALEVMQSQYNVTVYYPTDEEMAQFKEAMRSIIEWARDEYGTDKVDMMLDYAR